MKKFEEDTNEKRKLIKLKLNKLNCTQKDLAVAIGTNPTTFYMKISGFSKWQESEKDKICKFLQLTDEEQQIIFN
ncbi:MAG: hypothetical protein LBF97_04130 [Elusimicrobiota bacterium]|jgi:DNA-binding MarR family transcriptional regulator|nr:hypothetical protein [Elusimicrobiota bacterium]